ncbi:hypothetical protein HQO82_20995 [Rhodococcus fascians]|nr:hypothetical protein [Rhodococcus fascians]MBY4116309.1 hypothetical protein [Rhodococcus fascians]
MQRYRAIRFAQTESSKPIVLFSAPATDIDYWSGVPQRELLDGQETVGFQREENPNRLKQLSKFYSDPMNVVQNTLLCAAQDLGAVTFTPTDSDPLGGVEVGTLEISFDSMADQTLVQLFKNLKGTLEARSPELANVPLDHTKIETLTQRLNEDPSGISELDFDGAPETEESSEEDGTISGLYDSETHILEFYQEISCRCAVLDKLATEDQKRYPDEFLGFSRDTIESYLKPVLLVDGQHRLKGALMAADAQASADLRNQPVPDQQQDESYLHELRENHARLLPVSLLMSDNAEEHVFQFVVVNQKATPVGKALLGTIVATSLTSTELNAVTKRLEQVGIDVSDSQAVAWFTRNPNSPFYHLVQQGIGNEQGGKLPWNVLRELLTKFRTLSGARLFHDRIDYSDEWAKNELLKSRMIPAELTTIGDRKSYWSELDGPWRAVAAEFFSAVRDSLGNQTSDDSENYWGLTKSNLYNKQSLNILVADFFQWLVDTERTIDEPKEVRELVNKWLTKASPDYFARSWDLSGVKKDTPGIRAQWSELWVSYRKTGRLTDYRNYRKARQVG